MKNKIENFIELNNDIKKYCYDISNEIFKFEKSLNLNRINYHDYSTMKINDLLPAFITRHVLFALIFGGVCGIGFILFLIEFDHYTSTEEFCTSCHSMELAAEPYRNSTHYKPKSGVRASCGDCHVSEGGISATWEHIMGSKDSTS